MALQKNPININFARGLNTKVDAFQLPVGDFTELTNSVFTTAGRLTKRNGFENVTRLPNDNQITVTTLNDNLIATGSDLYAYSKDTDQWLDRGTIQPVQLDVQPLIRVSTSQTGPDTAISPSGLVCLVYRDGSNSYYQITDSSTGQQIVSRTQLPATAINPRVFLVGPWFFITYSATVAGTPTLQFIAIPTANPSNPQAAKTISTNLNSLNTGYDAAVTADTMFIAWGESSSAVGVAYITQNLAISPVSVIAGNTADLVSVTVDTSANMFWVSYWELSSTNGFVVAYNYVLGQLVTKTPIITTTPIRTITSVAQSGVLTVIYENINNYSYNDSTGNPMKTDFLSKLTVTPPIGIGTGTVSSTTVILRSVGLASKAFISDTGTMFMLAVYGPKDDANGLDNSNQSTYFLIDSIGNIYMRLAYSNGGGYASSQVIPTVTAFASSYYCPYLITDFLTTVNKDTAPPSGTPLNAIYTQTGVNMARFSLNTVGQYSSEIADALHLTGGQLWEYDGVKPVEHGFHVWPENVVATTSGTGGSITAQVYNYVFTYEWTDNQGMLHRSAPSIPFSITTTGSTSTNTIKVPTLRLTYKTAPNPVRIVGYRWSAGQPVYYQFTSLTSPTLNDTTADSVTFTDVKADSAILGQTILYTTGGVIEDIAAPASIASALFSNRLFLIDAEDRNTLWFSKQVIQSVPVEMSDLLTLYVAPTTGAQGSTGPMTALSAMDDKLIVFKKDAIYYINGSGPDNTGANSTFSDPVFVTATVGCANPNSIVLMPSGIMFQSDKGIWLLGRDLSTQYIGAAVEAYNDQIVMSATAIPGTNQVRFVLNDNLTLMYDYFYQQWATHTNVNAISATLYQGMHTYLNSYGQVFQETLNTYVDGSVPVLMSLTTSWINLAGVQGLERFYFGNLLGTYLSPFKLDVQFAYNYNPSPQQSIPVTPDNYGGTWGSQALWGSGPQWGGSEGNVFTARLFPNQQKCQSFQVTINELYDSSFGVAPGAGLTLSGLALIVGTKRGFRTQSAAKSFG